MCLPPKKTFRSKIKVLTSLRSQHSQVQRSWDPIPATGGKTLLWPNKGQNYNIWNNIELDHKAPIMLSKSKIKGQTIVTILERSRLPWCVKLGKWGHGSSYQMFRVHCWKQTSWKKVKYQQHSKWTAMELHHPSRFADAPLAGSGKFIRSPSTIS